MPYLKTEEEAAKNIAYINERRDVRKKDNKARTFAPSDNAEKNDTNKTKEIFSDSNKDGDDNKNIKIFYDSGSSGINKKGKGLKILTSQQMLSRLPILLAQIQAGYNSIKLKNETRQILYSLYRSKASSKTVYNKLIKSI